jgi:hypothetical protein
MFTNTHTKTNYTPSAFSSPSTIQTQIPKYNFIDNSNVNNNNFLIPKVNQIAPSIPDIINDKLTISLIIQILSSFSTQKNHQWDKLKEWWSSWQEIIHFFTQQDFVQIIYSNFQNNRKLLLNYLPNKLNTEENNFNKSKELIYLLLLILKKQFDSSNGATTTTIILSSSSSEDLLSCPSNTEKNAKLILMWLFHVLKDNESYIISKKINKHYLKLMLSESVFHDPKMIHNILGQSEICLVIMNSEQII